jgi:hypothetical protein
MPKRKPPSQRPERVLDETARAIARAKDETRSEKPDQPERGNESKTLLSRLAKSIAPRRDDRPPGFPLTKRSKKG